MAEKDVVAIRVETTSDGGQALTETSAQLSELDARSQELAQGNKAGNQAWREHWNSIDHAGVSATQAAGRFDRLKSTIGAYGKQILIAAGITAGMAGAIGFVRSSIRAFGEQEQALAKLRGVARGLGLDYELVRDEVSRAASAMQRKTLFADEKQIDALGSLILYTRDYSAAMKHHNLLLDLATGLNMDLTTASRYLALGIQGDYTMLKRYVPALKQLTDEQLAAGEGIKTLQKTFSGLSEEVSQTRTGRIRQAANAWDDLKESVGGFFLELTGPLAKDAARDIESLRAKMEEFALTGSWNKIEAPRGILFEWAEEQRKLDAERFARARLRGEFFGAEWRLTEGLKKRTSFFFEGELVGKGKSLIQDIREEMEKSEMSLEKVDQKAREFMETSRQIKRTWHEIHDLQLEQARVPGRMAGTVLGALEKTSPEIQAELIGGFGHRELAPGLTLKGAFEKTEGISGFQRFQDWELVRLLRSGMGITTGARSKLAAELLETKLGMLESATTPRARESAMESVFQSMQMARATEIARIDEEIQDRKRLVMLTDEQATLSRQMRDYLFALLNETREFRRRAVKDGVSPEDIF